LNTQILLEGLVSGSMIGLGAIGLTLCYSIMRFANFAHGELIAWGAYFAWLASAALGAVLGLSLEPIEPFSFGWSLIGAAALALPATAALALLVDALLFRRLRRREATIIILVIASFGASIALRSLLEFVFTSKPHYFSGELQIAQPLFGGIRATPDQLLVLGVTTMTMLGVHLLLARSNAGREMRAVSENPALAAIAGIEVARVVRRVWALGGALAAVAGLTAGLLVQIRPYMGLDLLLPLFAAAILGGIGSVPGAFAGGLFIGLCEAVTVQTLGAEWRQAVAFVVLTAVLIVRPGGLFGRAPS